jgi:hypothetical protein
MKVIKLGLKMMCTESVTHQLTEKMTERDIQIENIQPIQMLTQTLSQTRTQVLFKLDKLTILHVLGSNIRLRYKIKGHADLVGVFQSQVF